VSVPPTQVFCRQMLSSLRDIVIGWYSGPVVALRLPPANSYDPFGVKIVQSKRRWASACGYIEPFDFASLPRNTPRDCEEP